MKILTDIEFKTMRYYAEELVVSHSREDNLEGISMLGILDKMHTFS